ncbi:MAG TPA: ABC transporter permease subunit [Candidatus Polarisedimenticolia bacterium]|nr:ABC transporter permease subunit [Candidatus Polarisedimenticolia bacterium]
MPIYDQSYRPYRGALTSHTWRWWTITQAGLMQHLSRRLTLIFLFVAIIPAIVQGVIIWFSHQVTSQQNLFTVDPAFFRNFLWMQGPFLMLVCVWPGATLIARDLKTNAIQLYLSRPLTRTDYVLGKFGIVAGVAMLLLPVPALLLFIMEIGLSTDTAFLARYFWIPFAILGYSAVVITGAALLSLALSSITRSGRYAGLLFFALVICSRIAAGVATLLTQSHAWNVLSIGSLMDQVGALFFGGETEYGMHPVPAAFMYALLVSACLLILRRRVKAVEIVT